MWVNFVSYDHDSKNGNTHFSEKHNLYNCGILLYIGHPNLTAAIVLDKIISSQLRLQLQIAIPRNPCCIKAVSSIQYMRPRKGGLEIRHPVCPLNRSRTFYISLLIYILSIINILVRYYITITKVDCTWPDYISLNWVGPKFKKALQGSNIQLLGFR